MDKKWMILLCTISILTLISSIICSCIVFYNEQARTETNSNKVLANNYTHKNTTINYYQNNQLNIINITPGYKIEQRFSITNNNSDTIKYNIVWENIKSNWTNNDFIYTISCSDGQNITNQVLPNNNEKNIIFQNLELKTNKTNECTIRLEYLNQENTINNNNLFSGTYKIIITE